MIYKHHNPGSKITSKGKRIDIGNRGEVTGVLAKQVRGAITGKDDSDASSFDLNPSDDSNEGADDSDGSPVHKKIS